MAEFAPAARPFVTPEPHMSAVESGTAAPFLPELAAKSLPEERFALVSVKAMRAEPQPQPGLEWASGGVTALRAARH
jgi:hypothetical protein